MITITDNPVATQPPIQDAEIYIAALLQIPEPIMAPPDQRHCLNLAGLFAVLSVTALIDAHCRLRGANAQSVVGGGVFHDSCYLIRGGNLQRGLVAVIEVFTNALPTLAQFATIAWWDSAELVWRSAHPANQPIDFARAFSNWQDRSAKDTIPALVHERSILQRHLTKRSDGANTQQP
jgi:hypothetical protein